ncbi:hypothetical protein CQA78_30985, partial [Klebsiella pneumoniae]
FAMTPVQFCAEHDWLGNDVWFAHLVKLLPEEIDLDAARQKFAMTPVQFCAEHDWLGNDVWFAHLVKLLPEEI